VDYFKEYYITPWQKELYINTDIMYVFPTDFLIGCLAGTESVAIDVDFCLNFLKGISSDCTELHFPCIVEDRGRNGMFHSLYIIVYLKLECVAYMCSSDTSELSLINSVLYVSKLFISMHADNFSEFSPINWKVMYGKNLNIPVQNKKDQVDCGVWLIIHLFYVLLRFTFPTRIAVGDDYKENPNHMTTSVWREKLEVLVCNDYRPVSFNDFLTL
jgi:hypothetical protein